MTLDIPNAFVQTPIPEDREERIIMKICSRLIDILCKSCPGVYEDYMIIDGMDKLLYVSMKKALYGMMIALNLYYKKFRKDIEEIGLTLNPYDICVTNRMVDGKQHTITWHVDDVKSSHVDPRVNDEFAAWCEETYGDDQIGHVKVVHGKVHDYLAMTLDYTKPEVHKIDMFGYVE